MYPSFALVYVDAAVDLVSSDVRFIFSPQHTVCYLSN